MFDATKQRHSLRYLLEYVINMFCGLTLQFQTLNSSYR